MFLVSPPPMAVVALGSTGSPAVRHLAGPLWWWPRAAECRCSAWRHREELYLPPSFRQKVPFLANSVNKKKNERFAAPCL